MRLLRFRPLSISATTRHGRQRSESSRTSGERRPLGTSDVIDAEHAACEVLTQRPVADPTTAHGPREAIRLVRTAHGSGESSGHRHEDAHGHGDPDHRVGRVAWRSRAHDRLLGQATGGYRLNRGGNRRANAALSRAVVARMRGYEPTIVVVGRRTTEGLSRKDIIRGVTRFLVREVLRLLAPTMSTPVTRDASGDVTLWRSIGEKVNSRPRDIVRRYDAWRTRL